MCSYQDEDDLLRTFQHLRKRIHVVMSVNMPVWCMLTLRDREWHGTSKAPFHKVLVAFTSKTVEPMLSSYLGSNPVILLFVRFVMSPFIVCQMYPIQLASAIRTIGVPEAYKQGRVQ